MRTLATLFANNRAWAERLCRQDPEFFEKLSRQQKPGYLWIGCADSRVPANDIVGLMPGELFVHRNIANLVIHTDFNCLSVIQYAVEILEVRHVIVCGHYGCGGVGAALRGASVGLADNWLRHVEDVRQKYQADLARLPDAARWDRLCELNVIEQVANVCRTSMVQQAWARQQPLCVHGWIYSIQDGLLRDLKVTIQKPDETATVQAAALAARRGEISGPPGQPAESPAV